MPSADRNDLENFHDIDKELDRDPERDRDKGAKSKSSSSKAKDLSHVPCKFFKVGSCTAGASCPFSHNLQEAGGQKDVCAWFVKGNCKFGHKCALAHVLPGQSMAMDRKNKKAAQVAAGGGSRDVSKGGRGQKRDIQTAGGGSNSNVPTPARNLLLSGPTAPTRTMQSTSRPPITMPLKASISPSAPAPPLKDTDFASFVHPDDQQLLSVLTPGKAQPAAEELSDVTPTSPSVMNSAAAIQPITSNLEKNASDPSPKSPPSPGSLPVSNPSAPRGLGLAHKSSNHPSLDFGPIGSPPRSATSGTSRTNGFSPGTSPHQNNFLSSSPFSAPGAQSVFLSFNDNSSTSNPPTDFTRRSGLAASLGATQTWNTDFGPVPSQVSNRTGARNFGRILAGSGLGASRNGLEVAVDDEDFEDFLPSSLTDLLTPEERSRRMSRSNSGQPTTSYTTRDSASGVNVTTDDNDAPSASSHNYSRSVPAPSLLGDIRSIWSDNTNTNPQTGLPSSPPGNSHHMGLGIGSGNPSSFKSASGFGGRSFNDDNHSPSPSILSPSNASAAFLPGLHHHYLNSKTGGVTNSLRAPSNPNHPSSGTGAMNPHALSSNVNNFVPSTTLATSHFHTSFGALNNANTSVLTGSKEPYFAPGRPIPSNANGFGYGLAGQGGGNDLTMANPLSPSARALQAHAPGQSLPQGLAAGYSRIHALPPPPSIPSPGAGGYSPGYGQSSSPTVTHDWSNIGIGAVPTGQGNGVDGQSSGLAANANAGLETMFSRLSYSAAASRNPSASANSNSTLAASAGATAHAPGMARNISGGGRHWTGQGPLSPLSGPVVTGDDDDLFSMDG